MIPGVCTTLGVSTSRYLCPISLGHGLPAVYTHVAPLSGPKVAIPGDAGGPVQPPGEEVVPESPPPIPGDPALSLPVELTRHHLKSQWHLPVRLLSGETWQQGARSWPLAMVVRELPRAVPSNLAKPSCASGNVVGLRRVAQSEETLRPGDTASLSADPRLPQARSHSGWTQGF